MQINKLRHKHIVEFIAAITRPPSRYLMFRWADGGNLREFWQTHRNPVLSAQLVEDVVAQLRGLADGLDALHDFRGASYRHGDLKPENILRVRTKPSGAEGVDVGLLKIADFGLAKHHDVVTDLRPPDAITFTTFRYEPPEVGTGRNGLGHSRRYDLWSMGCLTLEFMIWLLYGSKSLDEFNARIVGDLNQKTQFYVIEKVTRNARLHPAVTSAMDEIAKDQECKGNDTATARLLTVVRTKLLVINLSAITKSSQREGSAAAVTRATALDLRNVLDKIRAEGQKKKNYWFTGKDRALIKGMRFAASKDVNSGVDSQPRSSLPMRGKDVQNVCSHPLPE